MPVIYLVVSITIIWLSLVTMLYNFSTNRTWSLLEIYNTFFLNKSALLSLGYCLVSGCQMIIFRLYCSIFLLYFFFLKKKGSLQCRPQMVKIKLGVVERGSSHPFSSIPGRWQRNLSSKTISLAPPGYC